jgi:hypothetical protein
MSYLLEKDAINGAEGTGFIKDKSGNWVEMFGLKSIEANMEFSENDFRVVGTTIVQKKTSSVELTGSATLYYGTTDFLEYAEVYLKTGRLPYFSIIIQNKAPYYDPDDPLDSQGLGLERTKTVALYGVKLSSLPVALLDAEADVLEEEVEFSYTSLQVLDKFSSPTAYGGTPVGAPPVGI